MQKHSHNNAFTTLERTKGPLQRQPFDYIETFDGQIHFAFGVGRLGLKYKMWKEYVGNENEKEMLHIKI